MSSQPRPVHNPLNLDNRRGETDSSTQDQPLSFVSGLWMAGGEGVGGEVAGLISTEKDNVLLPTRTANRQDGAGACHRPSKWQVMVARNNDDARWLLLERAHLQSSLDVAEEEEAAKGGTTGRCDRSIDKGHSN